MEEQKKDNRVKLDNKLIVVSHTEPYSHDKIGDKLSCKKAVSGVTTALDPLMQKYNGFWIAVGGSGNADFLTVDKDGKVLVGSDNKKYFLKRIKLSKNEISGYYLGFANKVIWPVFHLSLERASFSPRYWQMYKNVNEKFARSILEHTHERNFVFIHDYHFLLLPGILRKMEPKLNIAFFHHIPWPPWEVFRNIPWGKEILKKMLGCDLIAFHTKAYANNFMNCVDKSLIGGVDRGRRLIINNDKVVKIRSIPLGVDYNSFNNLDFRGERISNLNKRMRAEKLILSVDRLDYTKGILNRLIAFERFLEKYKEYVGKVVLIQIASPTRSKIKEYIELKKQVDEYVGRINSKFRKIDWVPIHYFYRSVPQNQLFFYYQAADVALVTPLIDGMNLVSKEYIAAKGKKKNGVLILSKFAGAAEELKDALLVNPYDIEEMADNIKYALDMDEKEKRLRFEKLKKVIKENDLYNWLDKFLEEWTKK